MNPSLPPDGPRQQGGSGYPQPPAHPGPPPPPVSPHTTDSVPGQATTVRVLMFIGGPVGIAIGAVLGVIALLGFGSGQASQILTQGEVDSGSYTLLAGALGVFALIPLVYGLVSTTLAALMGRRKKGIFWGVVAFNIVAALIVLVAVVVGDSLSLVPLAFHTTMTALMFSSRVRAFYGL